MMEFLNLTDICFILFIVLSTFLYLDYQLHVIKSHINQLACQLVSEGSRKELSYSPYLFPPKTKYVSNTVPFLTHLPKGIFTTPCTTTADPEKNFPLQSLNM